MTGPIPRRIGIGSLEIRYHQGHRDAFPGDITDGKTAGVILQPKEVVIVSADLMGGQVEALKRQALNAKEISRE